MDNHSLPDPVLQVASSAAFGVVAVIVCYFAIDTVGLLTGPLHPDVLMAILLGSLALGAGVFVYTFDIRYTMFFVAVFPTIPLVVYLREYSLHGVAGVDSPVTTMFVIFILGAVWVGAVSPRE